MLIIETIMNCLWHFPYRKLFCSRYIFLILPQRFSYWQSKPANSVQSLNHVSLRLHGLQHARLPWPSPTPRACSNSFHQVSDVIQPSHPLLFPSLSVNLSHGSLPLMSVLEKNLSLQWFRKYQMTEVLFINWFFCSKCVLYTNKKREKIKYTPFLKLCFFMSEDY